MGFLDDIVAQQSGGGMLGGLPPSWQYTNPESLSPEQKQMMALVSAQDAQGAAPAVWPDQTAGAAPGAPPAPPISQDNLNTPTNYSAGATPAAAFPTGGAAPIAGLLPQAPAVPAFGAGATPMLFANPAGSTPGNPAMPGAPMAKPPVVAADDGEEEAPAANAPASPLSIGGYQMPRIGNAASFAPDPAALPINAQPTQGQLPAAPAAAPSIGNKLMTGYQNLHHGGGLIGSIVAAVTGKRNDPTGVATDQAAQIANMTARALINKGVSQEVAIAAVQPGNAELLKHLLTQVYAPKTVTALGEGYVSDKDGNVRRAYTPEQKDNFVMVQTGEDGMGRKTFQKMNKATGDMAPVAGGSNGGGGSPLGDLSKTGSEYLATVPKEHQGVLKGIIDGTIQPPTSFAASKPYWQNMIASAKQLDPKFDENNWAARHKMSTDLASSGNSSMGGILANGESAFKHLAEYAAGAADQGNASHNFPLGGMLARGQNYVGNSLGGSDTKAKVKALNDNLGHYGQESTKFYAGTGGGVEERMHALKELNAETTSGEEAAAYAEKEKGLMLDRLTQKLHQIKDTFGEEQGNTIIAKHMPEIQKSIALIDANVAKLRGQAAPATAAEASASIPTLKIGETANVNGVSIKKVK